MDREASEVIDIGTRRQLFVDDFLIDNMEGVELRLHAPESRGVVVEFEEAWEGSTIDYHTVVKEAASLKANYPEMICELVEAG